MQMLCFNCIWVKIIAESMKSEKSSPSGAGLTTYSGGSKPGSRQGSFNVSWSLTEATLDPTMISKINTLFLNFLTLSHKYCTKSVFNLNYLLKQSISYEIILSALRTSIHEKVTLDVIAFMLLCDSYEYSKLKNILIQRIEDSRNSYELIPLFLNFLQKHYLVRPFKNILNLERVEAMLKDIRAYCQLKGKRTIAMMPQQCSFNKIHICNTLNSVFSTWKIFRADDFDFGGVDVKSRYELAKNRRGVTEEQEATTNPINNEIAEPKEEDEVPKPRIEDVNLDMPIPEIVHMRPKLRSSRKSIESNPSILYDSSSRKISLCFTEKELKMPSSGLLDHQDVSDKGPWDGNNVDWIFELQEGIELSFPYANSMLHDSSNSGNSDSPKVAGASKQQPGKSKEEPACNMCKRDDEHIFFHGLGNSSSLHVAQTKGCMDISTEGASLTPKEVYLVVNCCSDNKPAEWNSLKKGLGIQFNTECIGVVEKRPPSSGETSPKLLSTIVSFENTTYVCVNSPTKLASISTDLTVPPSQRYVVLYGQADEIIEYKNQNISTLCKYDRVISLTKTYDIYVLQFEVTQVTICLTQVVRSVSQNSDKKDRADKFKEKLHLRELVSVAVVDKRLRLLLLEKPS